MTNEKIIIDQPEDIWDCLVNDLPYGIYLYYLDKELFTELNTSIISNSASVLSVQYTPFLDRDMMLLRKVPYDTARFGRPDSNRPVLPGNPYVYRIQDISNNYKKIGEFKTYDLTGVNVGKDKPRNWKNESRLYNYPFSFAMLTDHINDPLELRYHLLPRTYNQEVWVKNSISDRCSYGLFVSGYKNDIDGNMEAIVSGDGHELPCSSSAYAQWFASSKNQTAFGTKQSMAESFQQQRHAMTNNKLSTIGGVGSAVGATLGGNFLGGLIGGATSMIGGAVAGNQLKESGSMSRQGIIGNTLAQQSDLKSTPNTLVSKGSDIMYGLMNGEKKVSLYRYSIDDTFARKLGDYFAMYGYKVNRLDKPSLTNRYYYNYIKMHQCNISSSIPREYQDQLKSIYEKGTTIWHITREGVVVGDYSKDNAEI